MALPLRSIEKGVTMSALVPKPMVAASGWPASIGPQGGELVAADKSAEAAGAPRGNPLGLGIARDPKGLRARRVQIYPGLGCMAGGFGDGCICRQPMFQVDGWGRLFYPCAATYTVGVADNAGNEILSFGHYGNVDSRGPGQDSLIKTPAVPLGWPEAVGVSEKAIYVSDVLNRRIMRLMKKYAAEEIVAFQ